MSDHDPQYDMTTPEGARHRDAEQLRKRVPEMYRAATATEPGIVRWCEAMIAAAGTDGPKLPLLITGPTGTGKTWQAYGAIRLIATRSRTEWLATTGPDLYALLRPGDGRDSEGQFARWSSVPLLLIDDFGAEQETAWTEKTDYRVVNHRSVHLLPTIFTTNLPVRADHGPSLQSVLSERVFSRLRECVHVALKGSDRRKPLRAVAS